MKAKDFDVKKFNKLFVKNFQKDYDEIYEAMEELRHVPYVRRHLPIR